MKDTSLKRSYLRCFLILCLFLEWAFLLPHCAKEKEAIPFAPDFTLKTLNGQEITLSNLRGKVILLDFWATWCGPCRESIPHLVQLYKTYREKGVETIGLLSMDKSDTDIIRRFVTSLDIPYPIVITPDDVVKNYGVTGLPTTFLIDKEGKIREKFIGFSTTIAQQIAAKVADLSAEKP